MHDIDLIPQEYRMRVELARLLRTYGLVAAAIVVLGLGTTGIFMGMNSSLARHIGSLQGETAISDQQRIQLEALRDLRDRSERQLELLTQLRSGTSAREIFITLDNALDGDDIWFRKWTFKRAMEALDEAQITLRQQNRDEGFFIVIPVGQTDREYWEIRTHMTIDGEARNHQVLSRFVGQLYAQPAIEDVKVLQTSLQRTAAGESVVFQLAIVVGPGGSQNVNIY